MTALKRLVESREFNLAVIILIFLGAGIVGLVTYPGIHAKWGKILGIIDWIIIACFSVEISLRILAELPRPLRYFRDPWNLFDVSIVTLCLLPLDSEAVIAIRIVRLLRIMRIFRALPKLRLLIRGMAHSISSVGYVAVLLLVHFYLFAVIGVSLFGSDDPRHFGNLGSAILTLFQVLTLENWPDVMAPVKAAHPLVGVFFFIGFIVTGTMVVMNLFVGVIVGGMSEAIQEDRKEDSIERKIADDVRDVREAFARMENKINAIEHRLRTAGDAEGERPGRGSKAPA